MERQVNVASDYATLRVGALRFYYGYEHVWCNTHKQFATRCDDECATEWAFTVSRDRKIIAEYQRSREIDEFNVEQQLIHGLGHYIAEKTT